MMFDFVRARSREARFRVLQKISTKSETKKKLGDLGWVEYRELKKGSEAFNEIHNGTCIAPKIILIP